MLLDEDTGGSIGAGALTAVVFFSVVWNLWHVFMQKFGILRLYMAKDSAPVELKTAAWVDKYFVLCWFPLYLSYLGPTYKDTILSRGQVVAPYTSAIIEFMERYRASLIAPSVLVAVGGVGLWLWYDWRAHKFQNYARLSAATGTLMISTALFLGGPIEGLYCVRVQPCDRIHHLRLGLPATALSTASSQALPHAAAAAASEDLVRAFDNHLASIGILQVLGGRTILTHAEPPDFFGITLRGWILYYAVYQSLVHFYLDGFLWKMRKPEVRANI